MDKWVIRTPGTSSANKRTNTDEESQNSELNAPSKKKEENTMRDLLSSNKGLRGLIQKVAPHMVFNHCRIHRQALVAKDMDKELHNILQDAVSSINYIKCNCLNSLSFQYFAMRWAQRVAKNFLSTKGVAVEKSLRTTDLHEDQAQDALDKPVAEKTAHRKKCTSTANCFIVRHPGTGSTFTRSPCVFSNLTKAPAEGHLGLRRPLRGLPLMPTHRPVA
ncbi:zinc finger MYM-type protein 6 [Trichonephila clavipes]|nr:zinc finger MYM-type protein 6 [Trichonephila clavipes]